MRIVHVSYAHAPEYREPSSWLRRIGFFTGIAESMAREHDVHSLHGINYNGSLKHEGVNYHFFKPYWWREIFPVAINHCVKILDPEVVIVHGLHFSWQIFLLHAQLPPGVRFFVQHHAEKPVRYHKILWQRMNDRFINGYFFSSADLAKPWLDNRLIADKGRIYEVMEASSSFKTLDRSLARKKTGVGPGLSYLWVGRLDSNKDPETLLKAFTGFAKTNPEMKLYMIFQEDQLLNSVRSLATALPAQIELIGEIEHEELLYWYNSADFIISTSHYESGGIAICEGMSCGCIPILSDIPSFRMMTGNVSVGMLFPPGNAAALEDALKRSALMNQPAERERVLSQFRKNLSFEGIAEKMISAFTK